MPISFEQSMTFQPKRESRLDEFTFTGGLVTDAHETKLDTSQSPDMANVLFNETGSIKTRGGYTRYNNNPVGATADQENFGTSTGTLTLTEASDFVAQTFEVSGDIETVQVDLSLSMENSGEEQRVRAELWSTDTGPDNIISTKHRSQVKNVDSDSEETVSFRFRVPNSLSLSTTYALVLRPFIQGGVTTINQVNVHHTGNDYASGSVWTSDDTGQNWTQDTAKDLKFRVYKDGNVGGTGAIRFYGEGVNQQIVKIGGSLYLGNDVTGEMSEITLGSGETLHENNHIDWTVSDGTLLIVDDNGFIQKYRGSTNDNYSVGTISVDNESNTVTGSGTSWGTLTNVESGEYIQLPDGKWYKITGISSDTSLTIEVAYQGSDTSGEEYVISPWGEVQGALGRSELPAGLQRPAPGYIETHINRVWTLQGGRLRFSVLDTSVAEENFNDWDTANNAGQIIIPFSKGDIGTGLYSLNNSLYVFGRRSIWRLYGNSPANFELRDVTRDAGLIDRKTLIETDGILVFLGEDGIFMFDGSNVKNISDGVVQDNIRSWANKHNAVATLWDNKYVIAYTPSGESFNSEALFFDLTRNVYGKLEEVYASSWATWGGGTDTGEIYFVSSNQGSIYKWDIGRNDDGYEIKTLYDTPSIHLGANVNDKTLKRFYLQQLAMGDYSMNVTMFSDITADEMSASVDLSTGAEALWDVAQWDDATWPDEGSIITTRIAEFQGVAKYFKFRFEEESLDGGLEILGMTMTARQRRLA